MARQYVDWEGSTVKYWKGYHVIYAVPKRNDKFGKVSKKSDVDGNFVRWYLKHRLSVVGPSQCFAKRGYSIEKRIGYMFFLL